MHFVVQQIEGLRQALVKWPTLAEMEGYWFPPKLNREQSSSEATARLKADLFVKEGMRVADLTGGMGIDATFFALKGAEVDYCEVDTTLCQLMLHNSQALGLTAVHCHHVDSMEWLAQGNAHYDLLFVDPARRDAQGERVVAFEACTPNLLNHLPMLRACCGRLVVKASPMIDLKAAVAQLGEVGEVHILSLNGECKEVLFVCEPHVGEPQVVCHLLGRRPSRHSFLPSEEQASESHCCTSVGSYLYDPDPALMKAAPYRLLCHWYGVAMLAHNSHLYTNETLITDFPGRVFRVIGELPPNRKTVAKLIADRKAHVVVRNYPLAAADLQRKLGLQEGGTKFVIATTVGTQRVCLLCERVT